MSKKNEIQMSSYRPMTPCVPLVKSKLTKWTKRTKSQCAHIPSPNNPLYTLCKVKMNKRNKLKSRGGLVKSGTWPSEQKEQNDKKERDPNVPCTPSPYGTLCTVRKVQLNKKNKMIKKNEILMSPVPPPPMAPCVHFSYKWLTLFNTHCLNIFL